MRDPDKCPTCGEHMVGDGHTSVRHCARLDIPADVEADAGPLYCCGRSASIPEQRWCSGCVRLESEATCKSCIEGDL